METAAIPVERIVGKEEGCMIKRVAVCLWMATALIPYGVAEGTAPQRPRAGKVEIFKESDLKPGMKATAWTVFSGTVPEPIPVEIIGIWKNANGPKEDVILAKLGGKAVRTNVAGGMS